MVYWLTGLTGAGKSSLAQALHQSLDGFSVVLDADEIRRGLNSDLTFSEDDRKENIRRIAQMARLLSRDGVTVITASISPLTEIRELAGKIVGADHYIEVFLDTPMETCRQRDSKCIYRDYEDGKISLVSGLDFPYEPPGNPDIHLKPGIMSLEEEVSICKKYLQQLEAPCQN